MCKILHNLGDPLITKAVVNQVFFYCCLICSECHSSSYNSSNTSLQVFPSGWQAFSLHWRWSLYREDLNCWVPSYSCIPCHAQELSFWSFFLHRKVNENNIFLLVWLIFVWIPFVQFFYFLQVRVRLIFPPSIPVINILGKSVHLNEVAIHTSSDVAVENAKNMIRNQLKQESKPRYHTDVYCMNFTCNFL